MATTTIKTVTARLKLENGTDAEGNVKYVNQSLGDLSESYFSTSPADAINKIYAIRTSLQPILSKSISSTETVTTSTIVNN